VKCDPRMTLFHYHCKINYKIKDWSVRENSFLGEMCVRNQPLVDKENILLPPLNIKLGFMKNLVKAVNKHGTGFEYFR